MPITIICPYCDETVNVDLATAQDEIVYIHPLDSLKTEPREVFATCGSLEKGFHAIALNQKFIDIKTAYVNKKILLEFCIDIISEKFVRRIFSQRPRRESLLLDFIACSILFGLLSLSYIGLLYWYNKLDYIDNIVWGSIFAFTSLILLYIKVNCHNVRKSVDENEFPLNLSQQYLQSDNYTILKTSLKSEVFDRLSIEGHYFPISKASLCGLIMGILPLCTLVKSHDNIYVISTAIAMAIIFFIIGNAVYISLKTANMVWYVSVIPLKINPYISTCGMGIIKEIAFGSYYLIISVMMFFSYMTLSYIYFTGLMDESISSLKDAINYVYNSPLHLVIPYLIIILALYVVFSIYISPITNVHKQLVKRKDELINSIANKIDDQERSYESFIDRLQSIKLYRENEAISKMDEWPFKVDFLNLLWQVLTLLVLPILAIIIPVVLNNK